MSYTIRKILFCVLFNPNVIPSYKTQIMHNHWISLQSQLRILTTPFSKLSRPVFELFQTLFADTGPDVDETSFEVLNAYGPDVVW